MMLSCTCSEYDGDAEWYYSEPQDFTKLETKRSRKCRSCKKKIEVGAVSIAFDRYRSPRHEIEERIWGDEVSLADWYLCEECGEIFFNLSAAGYCIKLGDDMRLCLAEYHEISGFKGGLNENA
jgi:predicted RNA-binding Zn-ribbon protein involved in translation (DUF1610 family)